MNRFSLIAIVLVGFLFGSITFGLGTSGTESYGSDLGSYKARYAILHDESNRVVCQTSLANRPDLVPRGITVGSEEFDQNMKVPVCDSAKMLQLQQIASSSAIDNRTALLFLVVPLAQCGVAFFAGMLTSDVGSSFTEIPAAGQMTAGGFVGGSLGLGGSRLIARELFYSRYLRRSEMLLYASRFGLTGGVLGVICGVAGAWVDYQMSK